MTPQARDDGKKNFQAWISTEACDTIDIWCKTAKITRTAYLEAVSEWMAANPPGKIGPSPFLLRARQLSAESRARSRE